MPKPRYYNVLRGYRGAAARTAYLAYLAGEADQEPAIGTRGNRPESVRLYVTPFSIPLPADHQVIESALLPAWTLMETALANFATDTLGADTAVNIRSYHAPRLIRITKDPTGTVATSKVTKLPYLKYDNESMSVPFGRNVAGDTVQSVFSTLSTAVRGVATNVAVRLVAERT